MHNPKRRFLKDTDVNPVNEQQDSLSPLHQEPSLKQREDLSLNIFSLVIGLLIRCNILYNQTKNLLRFQFFPEKQEMATQLGSIETFSLLEV